MGYLVLSHQIYRLKLGVRNSETSSSPQIPRNGASAQTLSWMPHLKLSATCRFLFPQRGESIRQMTRQGRNRQDGPVQDRGAPGFKSVKLSTQIKNPKFEISHTFSAFPTAPGWVLDQICSWRPPLKRDANYRLARPPKE